MTIAPLRIGASLLFLDGMCWQSARWSLRRPLGGLQLAVSMLEAYEVDEISIVRPVRDDDLPARLSADLDELRGLRCTTPVALGGGLRSVHHLDLAASAPIERLLLSSAFTGRDLSMVEAAADRFGHQAVVALLPVRLSSLGLDVMDCALDRFRPLDPSDVEFVLAHSNEVVLADVDAEGVPDAFDPRILDRSGLPPSRTIVTGGVGRSTIAWGRSAGVAAVHIENRVLHREHSIREYRRG